VSYAKIQVFAGMVPENNIPESAWPFIADIRGSGVIYICRDCKYPNDSKEILYEDLYGRFQTKRRPERFRSTPRNDKSYLF
jgi:hypothetical protein